MKRFSYRAKDKKTGNIVKGNLQATTERAAGKLLVEQMARKQGRGYSELAL